MTNIATPPRRTTPMDDTAPAGTGERLSPQAQRLLDKLAIGPEPASARSGGAGQELYLAGFAEWAGPVGEHHNRNRLWWIEILPAGEKALRHDR